MTSRDLLPSFSKPVSQPASTAAAAASGTPGMTGTTRPATLTAHSTRNSRTAIIVIVISRMLTGAPERRLLHKACPSGRLSGGPGCAGAREQAQQVRQAAGQERRAGGQVDDERLLPHARLQPLERQPRISAQAGQADQ